FLTGDGKPTDDPALAAQINPANTWARFVAATVDRYRPGGAYSQTRGWLAGSGVRHWEIGNEPNLSHFWHGTPADFVRYLESAYLAAKWRDPDAVIIHGGIANDANAGPWYEQFADALGARAAASPLPARYDYYFDAAAWHWYTQVPYLTVPPARARSILSERGIPPKPIWVTEFGAPVGSEYPGPCWDPSSPGRVTTAEQSAFVWQTVAEGFSSGVEVMVYFQLFDDCGNGMESYDAFGLVRNHAANQCWAPPIGNDCWRYDPAMAGTTRPAYDAFRTIARELAGAHAVESTSGYGWQRVAFSRPPGARVTVAWNTTSRDRTIEIPAVAETATLFELDASGAVLTRTATSGAGRYQVLLTGATNRTGFMGRALTAGRPVILVEGSGFASAGYTSGAADRSPPYIAVVGELPALSAPRLDLAVLAADEASPLVALQVFYSIGAPPRDASGWLPVGSALPWPGTPQMGMVTLPFVGAPGLDYYFSAQAADAAGNWSAVPPYAQAHTRIVDDRRPLATPAPTVEPKAALRAPSAR
ncbi:MAG: glycosyl hydrolase, partial [Anaerolineae bacterium]